MAVADPHLLGEEAQEPGGPRGGAGAHQGEGHADLGPPPPERKGDLAVEVGRLRLEEPPAGGGAQVPEGPPPQPRDQGLGRPPGRVGDRVPPQDLGPDLGGLFLFYLGAFGRSPQGPCKAAVVAERKPHLFDRVPAPPREGGREPRVAS